MIPSNVLSPLALLSPLSSVSAMAQPTLTPVVSARDKNAGANSTLNLEAYTGPGCTGAFQMIANVIYGRNEEPLNTAHIGSYKLSRALLAGEQLDFSTSNAGQTSAGPDGIDFRCDHFLSTVTTLASFNVAETCINVIGGPARCYRLTQN